MLTLLGFFCNMEMSKNSRNWSNQFKLIKKILISSERRDEFQLIFSKS